MHLTWHMYLAGKAYIGSDLTVVKRGKKSTHTKCDKEVVYQVIYKGK